MTIYEKYAQIRAKMKELEIVKKGLEEEILTEIRTLSAPMKTAQGTFTTATRISWKYTEAVTTKQKQIEQTVKPLQDELTNLMKVEQEKGIAEKSESTSMRFIEIKK